jgi:hypothetical protein
MQTLLESDLQVGASTPNSLRGSFPLCSRMYQQFPAQQLDGL